MAIGLMQKNQHGEKRGENGSRCEQKW